MSKKLIIAISALALAILAGAVAVVGVFAAQQQKVANTFAITYTANNVSATAIAHYNTGNDSTWQTFTGPDEKAYSNWRDGVKLTADQAEKTKSLSTTDITFEASDGYLLFWFVFLNDNNPEGGRDMTVSMTDTSVMNNVIVYYYLTTEASVDDSYEAVAKEENKTVPTEAVTVAPQREAHLLMIVELDDDTLPASYVSTVDNGLHFTLNAVE